MTTDIVCQVDNCYYTATISVVVKLENTLTKALQICKRCYSYLNEDDDDE